MIEQETDTVSQVKGPNTNSSPMESNPHFCQERLGILSAQTLERTLFDRSQELAAQAAGLRRGPRKAQILVFRPVIVSLLLGKQESEAVDDF